MAKTVMIGVALLGLLIALAIFAHVGWRPVETALTALGVEGFAVFCAYTLGVFGLLGLAWFIIVPETPLRHIFSLIFGRLLREAAADILPFSQLGGFVMGARAATLLGVSAAMSIASSIVDLGAEMVGQLLFTVLGLVIIWRSGPSGFPHHLADPILAVGIAAGAALAGLFIFSQQAVLRLLDRFSSRWPASMRAQLSSVRNALQRLYRRPVRLLLSTVFHFTAWIAATGGVWLVLRFMGAPLSLTRVIALESLIYVLRSAAFVVPGALGVMEGGYVMLGPLFGVRPEIALSLSLIKRGRDLAIGLPTVLAWQTLESRRLLDRRPHRKETIGQD